MDLYSGYSQELGAVSKFVVWEAANEIFKFCECVYVARRTDASVSLVGRVYRTLVSLGFLSFSQVGQQQDLVSRPMQQAFFSPHSFF